MKTNSAPAAATQEARRRRTANTFAWLHGVNEDPDLQACDLKVALALTKHFNEGREGGAAWPSYKTIAAEIGLSEATVIRSVRRLSALGHLRVEWGQQGRGHPNRYWMGIPEKPSRVEVSEAVKPAPAQARKPAPVQRKPSPVQENLLKNLPMGVSKENPHREGEREEREGSRSSPPAAAARAPYEGRAAAGRERGSKTGAATEREFRELRAVWMRPWPDNDDAEARREFAKAPDAEEVLAAAREWVANCDAPRFLPTLSNWLAARGWETPPPQKRGARRSTGGGRRAGGRSRTRGEEAVAIALRMGGYTAGPDGRMACVLPDGSTSVANWGGVQ
jgi:Helix-turn-helix domain